MTELMNGVKNVSIVFDYANYSNLGETLAVLRVFRKCNLLILRGEKNQKNREYDGPVR